jgi:hypothetical protein
MSTQDTKREMSSSLWNNMERTSLFAFLSTRLQCENLFVSLPWTKNENSSQTLFLIDEWESPRCLFKVAFGRA